MPFYYFIYQRAVPWLAHPHTSAPLRFPCAAASAGSKGGEVGVHAAPAQVPRPLCAAWARASMVVWIGVGHSCVRPAKRGCEDRDGVSERQ